MSPEIDTRSIVVADIRTAMNLVVFQGGPARVEGPEENCGYDVCKASWPQCHFPRYSRNGAAVGLTAKVLIELGYPGQLLLDLDREYELGEILHPGVKINRSRNAALKRISVEGIRLLRYIQEHQKLDFSWGDISLLAFERRGLFKPKDRKKRPWLY